MSRKGTAFQADEQTKQKDVNAHNKIAYLCKKIVKHAILFKKCYKNDFFYDFSCTNPEVPLSLHRVFHSIRFKVTKVGSRR